MGLEKRIEFVKESLPTDYTITSECEEKTNLQFESGLNEQTVTVSLESSATHSINSFLKQLPLSKKQLLQFIYSF